MSISKYRAYLNKTIEVHNKMRDEKFLKNLAVFSANLKKILAKGDSLAVAGNGGSATEAQHIHTELVGRFRAGHIPFSVIDLTTPAAFTTAWGNDESFDDIFARQIEAHQNRMGGFLGFSTSGNSKNILQALIKARELKIPTFGILGSDGGKAHELCDHVIVVPAFETPHVQEADIALLHMICSEITDQW